MSNNKVSIFLKRFFSFNFKSQVFSEQQAATSEKELLRSIRHIEIFAKRVVNNIFSGEHNTYFKSKGMEFDEVREYVFGDNARDIDWKVTARMATPFIKRYREERQRLSMIVLDGSRSNYFGSDTYLKRDVAIRMAAIIAFSAIKNQDKVGLIIFTDKVELSLPPKASKSHVLKLIRSILLFKPKSRSTNLQVALDKVRLMQKSKSFIFVISDFLPLKEANWQNLKLLARHHQVVAIRLYDERERNIPQAMGYTYFTDAETGEVQDVDTTSTSFQQSFKHLAVVEAKRTKTLHSNRLSLFDLKVNKNYLYEMNLFFNRLR